jgi:hypothetical protein
MKEAEKMATKKPTLTCAVTGEVAETTLNADDSPKLPRGWKSLGERYFSAEGMKQAFVLRSITLPVASVLLETTEKAVLRQQKKEPEASLWSVEHCKEGWTAFRQALAVSWREVTQTCNWLMTRLALLDCEDLLPGKKAGQWKLPPFPNTAAIYKEAVAKFPELYCGSASSLVQKVLARYKQSRFAVRIRWSESLPNYRYPCPLPLRGQNLDLSLNEQRQPFVRTNIAKKRFLIRLRNGRDFERQMSLLSRVVKGELLSGEGNLREGRDATLFGLAVWCPRKTGERDNVLEVRTAPDHLLVAQLGDRPLVVFNEDQLKRWQAEHQNYRQRFAPDLKFEKRYPAAVRQQMLAALQVRCDRHLRRVHDRLHKVTASVANYAQRNRVAHVVYDDRCRDYVSHFPYYQMQSLLTEKLAAYGITLSVCEFDSESEPLCPVPEEQGV